MTPRDSPGLTDKQGGASTTATSPTAPTTTIATKSGTVSPVTSDGAQKVGANWGQQQVESKLKDQNNELVGANDCPGEPTARAAAAAAAAAATAAAAIELVAKLAPVKQDLEASRGKKKQQSDGRTSSKDQLAKISASSLLTPTRPLNRVDLCKSKSFYRILVSCRSLVIVSIPFPMPMTNHNFKTITY